MAFDLRLPIGILFTLFGVLLLAYGLAVPSLTLGININAWWGLVLLGFGGAMLVLAARGRSPLG